MARRTLGVAASLCLVGLAPCVSAAVEGNLVLSHVKLDDTALGSALVTSAQFGYDVTSLGDANGDSYGDIAVGARHDDTGGNDQGSFWLIFLDQNGAALTPPTRRFAEGVNDGGVLATILESGSGSDLGSLLGDGMAALPDFDGDATDELKLAVGASGGDPSGAPVDSGALFLIDIDKASWTISGVVTIRSGTAGFRTLDPEDRFGARIENLGDWDGDGAPEISVSASGDDDGGGADRGATYILFLKPDGTGVKTHAKLSDTEGGFDGVLGNGAFLGGSTSIGDLDGDEQPDLVAGAEVDGGTGSIFVIFMDPGCATNTTTVPHPTCVAKPGAVKISQGQGGFGGMLQSGGRFGSSVSWLTAEGGFGPNRLAVAAHGADSGDGEIWVLSLHPDGTAAGEHRITSDASWDHTLPAGTNFGISLGSAGDHNGDGITDLIVGAWLDDTGGTNTGAAYLMTLDPCKTIVTAPVVFHAPNDDGVNPCVPVQLPTDTAGSLHLYLESGSDTSTVPGDVCESETADGDELCAWDVRIEVESPRSILAFTPNPALGAAIQTNGPPYPPNELRVNWVGPTTPTDPAAGPIELGDLVVSQSQGSVRVASGSAAVGARRQLLTVPEKVLALPEPRAAAALVSGAALLAGLAQRRARSAARRRHSVARCAALLVSLPVSALLLAPAAPVRAAISVRANAPIGVGIGGLDTTFAAGENFAASVTPIGDLDGDGRDDLAVGTMLAGAGAPPGHLRILFLNEDQRVEGFQLISGTVAESRFGKALASLGDLDGAGPGKLTLAAGAPAFATSQTGAVHLLRLREDGTLLSRVVIDANVPALASLQPGDGFGNSIALLGDLDGNGTVEIAVGATGDNSAATSAGAVWLLSLDASGNVAAATKWTPPGGVLQTADDLGSALAALGDLDGAGPSEAALAIGASGDDDCVAGSCGSGTRGAFYVAYLEASTPGSIAVSSHTKYSASTGNLPILLDDTFGMGYALAWAKAPETDDGGVLYVGAQSFNVLWPVRLRADGSIERHYALSSTSGVGFVPPPGGGCNPVQSFGHSIATVPDLDGDERPDLAVGAIDADLVASPGCADGLLYLLFMNDTDFDGFDDNLDNCADVYNPLQEDFDDDGDGDLCDNCVDVANANQADSDTPDDGEGDACEPVELLLQTTGDDDAPSWELWLQCGAYSVTELAGAIVLPAGIDPDPPLTLTASSIGSFSVSDPGLASPAGVRGDAIYFQLSGNGAPDDRLCSALDPPLLLGTLACTPPSACPISGTQLAAAALSLEGVGTPGFGLAPAETAAGPVPAPRTRLVNGPPLPILDLELGPAVIANSCQGGSHDGASCTSGTDCPGGACVSGTRWEVCVPRASEEFHRVAFGLIAPQGTTTSQMRWLGCETTPNGSGQRSCAAGSGFAPGVNASQSWTVGPSASPPGTLLPHTLYAVLEGGRFSSGLLPTLNFPGQAVCLGTIELDSASGLEPALTTDGVNDLDDLFAPGNPVAPFEQVLFGAADPTQVKLIGQFNPADDLDGDGIQDLGDNCPFIDNAAQQNRGSFLDATDESDAFGDACQCAESNDDGAVLDPDDFDRIRDYLSGKVSNPVIAARIEERCSVAGTTECNIRDLVFLKLALDASAPSVETRCDAALSPAQGP